MKQKLTKQELKMFVLALCLAIPSAMCVDIYTPSMPAMVSFFHTSKHLVQLSIAYFVITLAVGQLIYGPLADRFGRKPIILIGASIGLLGIITCTFSTNIHLFLAGRTFSGIGFSAVPLCVRSIFTDLFDKKRLAIVSGYAMIASSTALVASPLLGGYLQHFFGWQASFIFLFCVVVCSTLGMLFLGIETRHSKNTQTIHPLKVIKNYTAIIQNRSFLAYILGNASAYSMAMSFAAVGAFLFQRHYHMTPVEYGWLAVVIAASGIPGRFIGSFLTTHLGVNKSIFISYSITGVAGLALLAGFLTGSLSALYIIIIVCLCTIGQVIMYPNGFAGSMQYYRHMAGTAIALQGSFQYLLASIVAAIVAAIAIHPTLLLSAIYVLLAAIPCLVFYRWVIAKPVPVPE